jgi:hypothetical protein
MQEQENKKDTPMVDIDTSGPSAEVELNDDVQTEEQVETKEQDTSPEPQATSDEKQEASSEETDDQKESKDKELENYSKDVQRRIAKLTGKWREAQRQRDEAIEFARAQKQKAEEVSKKYSSIEQASVKDREQSIVSGIEAAQAKLAAAREEGNISAEIEAQKQIARLGYEEARLAEAKQMAEAAPKVEKKTEQMPVFNQQPQQQQQVDPRAEAWGAENKWFGTDTAMTYTAFDIHNKLESEGYDPQSDEYYAEIDKRIRLEFPHKFATNTDKVKETTKPVQQVAAATRSTKTGRKTISLTPSEVAIAKKLGVSLEDYAKQKKHMKEV